MRRSLNQDTKLTNLDYKLFKETKKLSVNIRKRLSEEVSEDKLDQILK